jgi:hypothetical protein
MRRLAADLRRVVAGMGRGERLVAGGSLALLVGLFLYWISVSCSGPVCGFAGGGGGGGGFRGWGWLSFLALLCTVGLLVIRRLPREAIRLPELPAPDALLYTVLGGVEVAGCLLFWLEYHDVFVSVGGISIGLGLGWFISLLAGVATAAGGYLMRGDVAGAQPQQLELLEEPPAEVESRGAAPDVALPGARQRPVRPAAPERPAPPTVPTRAARPAARKEAARPAAAKQPARPAAPKQPAEDAEASGESDSWQRLLRGR